MHVVMSLIRHVISNPEKQTCDSTETLMSEQFHTHRPHNSSLPMKHWKEEKKSVNRIFNFTECLFVRRRIISLSSPTGPAEHWAGGSLDRSVSSWTQIKHAVIRIHKQPSDLWSQISSSNTFHHKGLVWRRLHNNHTERFFSRRFPFDPPRWTNLLVCGRFPFCFLLVNKQQNSSTCWFHIRAVSP